LARRPGEASYGHLSGEAPQGKFCALRRASFPIAGRGDRRPQMGVRGGRVACARPHHRWSGCRTGAGGSTIVLEVRTLRKV
jgi:hypothetical protein